MDNLIEDQVLTDEVTITAQEEVIGEGENAQKQLCFKGVFSEADTLNANKRVYPKSVLRDVFNEAIERSKRTGKPIFGELEHASDAHANLERIAVKFPELTWDEETGQIRGKAVPAGPMKDKVITLAEDGFPICFSTRMTGKVKPLTEERRRQLNITEDRAVEVCDGAKLVSIDVVGNQSCQKAISSTVYEETINEENKNPTFKTIFDSLL